MAHSYFLRFIFITFNYMYVYVSVCRYMHMIADAQRNQRHQVWSWSCGWLGACLVQRLRTELRSCKSSSPLNC